MKCPFCTHADTQVIDSRASDEGATIRRRRRCLGCDKRFTTYERVELALPTLIKRGGSRAEYDRNKLRASMLLALRKRPVPRETGRGLRLGASRTACSARRSARSRARSSASW